MIRTGSSVPPLTPVQLRALADECLRSDLAAFIRRVFETVAPGETLTYNWHIEAIAYALERVHRGDIRRLIITMPPRSLKSISVSVALPAFLLGHDPAGKIIAASYSDGLAVKHHNDCRAVMNAAWYPRIFPGTRIGTKNSEAEFVTTRRGGRFATSVGGTLTGRGGNLIIIDDPMKPEEAHSETARARVVQWLETTVLSRLDSKAEDAIVLVMQRLHVDDLAGVLLEKGGWEHLDLQAIADENVDIPIGDGKTHHRSAGDVLQPARESHATLDAIKAAMGSSAFSAQYQQRPVPLEGNMVKRQWLSFYDTAPNPDSGDILVISWDTASKNTELADHSVGTVWLAQGDNCYLLELVRGRFDFPALKRAALDLKRGWPTATILIEDKGSGISLIQELRAAEAAVIAINPDTDKVTRLYSVEPMFESGSVHFPKVASWLDNLLTEVLAFPHFRSDDQVDSISQALNWIRQRRRNADAFIGMPISIPNENGIIRTDWSR